MVIRKMFGGELLLLGRACPARVHVMKRQNAKVKSLFIAIQPSIVPAASDGAPLSTGI